MNAFSGDPISNLKQALTDLKEGKFVLVFDNESREGETDFAITLTIRPTPSRCPFPRGKSTYFFLHSDVRLLLRVLCRSHP